MLSPNNAKRGNTVISQSFIASQFQGFTDPYNSSNPTSSLNQFVRSKQTSDSGFIKEGQNQAFGFGNITQQQHQPSQLENTARNAQQQQTNRTMTTTSQGATQQTIPSRQQIPNQGQYYQNQLQNPNRTPQQNLNERYVSPGLVKGQSPEGRNYQPNRPQLWQQQEQQKRQQYEKQRQVQYQRQQEKQRQQNQNQYQNRPPNMQFPPGHQQHPQSQFGQQQQRQYPQQNIAQQSQSPQYNPPQQITNIAYTRPQQQQGQRTLSSQSQQTFERKVEDLPPVNQTTDNLPTKRLKLNISRQFSDSFTLDCVNEPQKSNILAMKKRQREFRKSIQNFIL